VVCGGVLLLWVLKGTARVLHMPPPATESPPSAMIVIVFLFIVFILLFLLFITVCLGNARANVYGTNLLLERLKECSYNICVLFRQLLR
jgi:hypothetical protein